VTVAAIYLRISLDQTGEGLAIARQREMCRAIAEQRGWAVAHELHETASASDRKKARPEYERLKRLVLNGEVDAVICYDLDRLTRQPRELEDWCDWAEQRAVKLVTASGDADLTTDSGRMFARVKATFARGEMERKSARQKAAARQRAQLGRPPLGTRAFGYTTKGETIEAEREVIAHA